MVPPTYGRFAQVDPAYDHSEDGLNLYSYVSNNPITRTDPDGMRGVGDGGGGGSNPRPPVVLDAQYGQDGFWEQRFWSGTTFWSMSPSMARPRPETTSESTAAGSTAAQPAETNTGRDQSIALWQHIADTQDGESGQVAGFEWKMRLLEGSVGHFAFGPIVDDTAYITNSEFPHGVGGASAPQGPNTPILSPSALVSEEKHMPDRAFVITVGDMGAFARAAIADLKCPTWNYKAEQTGQTNCTVGFMRCLEAGRVSVGNYGIFGLNTPGGLASYFKEQIHGGNPSIQSRPDLVNAVFGGNQ